MAVTQRIAVGAALAATCAAALAGCGIGEPTGTVGPPGANKTEKAGGRGVAATKGARRRRPRPRSA